jgi:hypothetical protein
LSRLGKFNLVIRHYVEIAFFHHLHQIRDT